MPQSRKCNQKYAANKQASQQTFTEDLYDKEAARKDLNVQQ